MVREIYKSRNGKTAVVCQRIRNDDRQVCKRYMGGWRGAKRHLDWADWGRR